MRRRNSAWVCKASAVHTRCQMGNTGSTCLATGMRVGFLVDAHLPERFLTLMGTEGQQMGSGLLARSGSSHGLARKPPAAHRQKPTWWLAPIFPAPSRWRRHPTAATASDTASHWESKTVGDQTRPVTRPRDPA